MIVIYYVIFVMLFNVVYFLDCIYQEKQHYEVKNQ